MFLPSQVSHSNISFASHKHFTVDDSTKFSQLTDGDLVGVVALYLETERPTVEYDKITTSLKYA